MYIMINPYSMTPIIQAYTARVYYSLSYSSLYTWDYSGWGTMGFGVCNWNEGLNTALLF